jgi:multidrug efflux pump subunit AcrA (membrane-fusion protein)
VLPPIAVGEDEAGRFVWVLEDAGDGTATVHRRAVTVGALTSDGLEIRDGLEDGERVVTAGVTRIHDGQKVRGSDEGM